MYILVLNYSATITIEHIKYTFHYIKKPVSNYIKEITIITAVLDFVLNME